jgi:ATP-dependent DNA ligase
LQQREQASDPVNRPPGPANPGDFIAFDVLYHNDAKLLHLHLSQRKEILQDMLGETAGLVESRYPGTGQMFFREVVARIWRVMAKALDSPYCSGPKSRHWLKIKPGDLHLFVKLLARPGSPPADLPLPGPGDDGP